MNFDVSASGSGCCSVDRCVEVDDHSNDDFFLESLRENTEVIATSTDWLTLAYLEPLLAKKHDARINGGEKAMRTLNLF